MRKWVTLGLVAAASLGLAGASFADVPSALTSTVACTCVADAGGGASTQTALNKCTITPSGTNPSEDLRILVTVRNVVGAPLALSNVTINSQNVGAAVFLWDNGLVPGGPGDPDEDPQAGVSDVAGNVTFIYDEGGVNQGAAPTFPNLDYAVTAAGPGPGGPVALAACTPQYSVVSYDLNGSGEVNLVDFALFGSDSSTGSLRSDFNWSGSVTLIDFALFGAEMGATINGQ